MLVGPQPSHPLDIFLACVALPSVACWLWHKHYLDWFGPTIVSLSDPTCNGKYTATEENMGSKIWRTAHTKSCALIVVLSLCSSWILSCFCYIGTRVVDTSSKMCCMSHVTVVWASRACFNNGEAKCHRCINRASINGIVHPPRGCVCKAHGLIALLLMLGC